MTFTFDEWCHKYTLDGRRLPSVTDIIYKVLPVHHWGTQWHLDRGTEIHRAAALIANGKEPIVDDQIKGQVEAVQTFFAREVGRVQMVEQPVYSARSRYAGTLDLFAELQSRKSLAIVDYKSSGCFTRTAIQISAYAQALSEQFKLKEKPKYGVMVTLNENGTYTCDTLKIADYHNKWRSVLNVYNIMMQCN